MNLVLAIMVFFSAIGVDLANTRYVKAVASDRPNAAAMWSVLQWCSGLVGFIIAVKVTLWMLPIEALGLYTGTRLSMDWGPRLRAMFVRSKVKQ